MSILDEMFQDMKNIYMNNPTKNSEELQQELDRINWEMTKLQSQKDLILDQIKKQTNAQTQDHPVATHSR